jgi:hypothetical protein
MKEDVIDASLTEMHRLGDLGFKDRQLQAAICLLSKEVSKSNFRQYGQMKSSEGKSQRREEYKKEKESEERRFRCAKR